MIELALAGITATVLTEGVKFLYGQASDMLNTWRKRRLGDKDTASATVASPPEKVFAGNLQLGSPDPEVLGRREQTVDDILLLPALVRIANGREADPADPPVVEAAEALRALLEDVYHTRITLVGEPDREPSGTPLVRGEAEAETVEGLLAGVDAGTIAGGTVHGQAKAKHVKSGATVAGVKVNKVG